MADLTARQPLQAPHRGIDGSAVEKSAQEAHLSVNKNDHILP